MLLLPFFSFLSTADSAGGEVAAVSSSIYVHDLNPDCLRSIFQYLNKETLFCLAQASEYFLDVIVYDMWKSYFKTSFQMSYDTTAIPPNFPNFYEHFLDFIFQHFPNVTRVRSDVFHRCMCLFENKRYDAVKSLAIKNKFRHSAALDMSALDRFPNLDHLKVDLITLDFRKQKTIRPLKSISMTNSKITNQLDGSIFENVFCPKLETLTLRSLCFGFAINFKNFIGFHKCSHLRELTLSCEYIYSTKLLDEIINLQSLELLTLEASNDFELIEDFRVAFDAVLEKFNNSPTRAINKVLFKGMPTADFFKSPHLRTMTCLGWFLTEGDVRLRETIIEWNLKTREFMESFYTYVVKSQNLMELLVNNNFIHTCVFRKPDAEQITHELRGRKGLTRLHIVNDDNEMYRTPYDENESLSAFHYITARFFLKSAN